MNLLTGLFRVSRKRHLTKDSGESFRDRINALVANKDTLSEEEIAKKVDELVSLASDLPDSEDKEKLNRFLADFKSVKEQDEQTAKGAADIVADFFEKLDDKATKEVTQTQEDVTPEATGDDTDVNEGAKDGETAPEEKNSEDSEETSSAPSPDFDLEEVYTFIKGRLEEDGLITVKKEADTEVTSDHAPHIPVSMNASTGCKTFDEWFERTTKGGR
jgi:hypothetical protein